MLIYLIIAAKILVPIGILASPFFLGWANFILDTIDGDILLRIGLLDQNYQLIDKATDYLTYIVMLVYSRKLIIKRELTLAFILRTVGQMLFFITNNELMLFFFPNFVEPIFLVYVTMQKFAKNPQETYKKHFTKIMLGIFLYKMTDEYITHVANIDRSDFIQSIFS